MVSSTENTIDMYNACSITASIFVGMLFFFLHTLPAAKKAKARAYNYVLLESSKERLSAAKAIDAQNTSKIVDVDGAYKALDDMKKATTIVDFKRAKETFFSCTEEKTNAAEFANKLSVSPPTETAFEGTAEIRYYDKNPTFVYGAAAWFEFGNIKELTEDKKVEKGSIFHSLIQFVSGGSSSGDGKRAINDHFIKEATDCAEDYERARTLAYAEIDETVILIEALESASTRTVLSLMNTVLPSAGIMILSMGISQLARARVTRGLLYIVAGALALFVVPGIVGTALTVISMKNFAETTLKIGLVAKIALLLLPGVLHIFF